jgi:hypothetical protein
VNCSCSSATSIAVKDSVNLTARAARVLFLVDQNLDHCAAYL